MGKPFVGAELKRAILVTMSDPKMTPDPKTPTAQRAIPYRSDIDGLRGIAVLLVLAFHFNLPPIGGGYIGVDIFFVVSGFLITSLLCQETAVFSPLVNFYRRRIKRLLPIYVVFAAATTAAAAILLLPEDFLHYLRSLLSSFLFNANSYFDRETKDYFASDAHQLPLLHVWTLSVEWQFYLLFPVLFLLARKWLPPRFLAVGLVIATLGLAAYSWHKTGKTQETYFHTSARFFELLIGSIAALVKLDLPAARRHLLVSAASIGLVGIGILFDSKTAFPGINALAVCLLAAVPVLWGTGNPLLGSSGLVHVGRISYSAYLWHWPFVAYFTYLQIVVSPEVGIVLLILVLGLAHLSYLWIERPGRQIQFSLWKLILFFVALPIAVSVGFYRLAKEQDGFPLRLGAESGAIHDKLRPYRDNKTINCLRAASTGTHECRFGDRGSGTELYLVGDSHAGHYRWFTQVLAAHARLRAVSISHDECLIIPGASHKHRGTAHDERCKNSIQIDYDRIKQARPKFVLLTHRWIGYPADEVGKLEDAVGLLTSLGTIPVILGPAAEDGTDWRACFYRHIKLRTRYEGECRIAEKNGFSAPGQERVFRLFKQVQARYPQLIVIDVQKVQCANGWCDAQIDGVPLYEDLHHLNGFGSATLASRYIERFGNPLEK